jgi:vanillate O-demethylase monooxygenase subunit
MAGWSSEVDKEGFLARTLLNTPVVLWREGSGNPVAFEDRCCHRGAPLSKGRREGDCVRCMYHGLKFDATGACVEIPGQEKIQSGFGVKTFPVVERHSWIWIWMGDADKADTALIPDTHWVKDPAWRSLEGYMHYEANYLFIADNLLDLAHLPYLHPNTLGGSEDYSQNTPKTEMRERGIHVSRWAMNTESPHFVQKVRPFPGKIDRWNVYDFLVPGIFLMDSGVATAGSGAEKGNRSQAAEFHACHALTPETDKTTHYFYCHPHNFAIDRPEVTASIHQSVALAFEEDRAMIEAQAKRLRLDPGFKMGAIRADEALGKFRRLVDRMIEQERRAERSDTAVAVPSSMSA